jgi:hypothetical protein
MKTTIECPLCGGHGLSVMDANIRFFRARLYLAQKLAIVIKWLTKQTEP